MTWQLQDTKQRIACHVVRDRVLGLPTCLVRGSLHFLHAGSP